MVSSLFLLGTFYFYDIIGFIKEVFDNMVELVRQNYRINRKKYNDEVTKIRRCLGNIPISHVGQLKFLICMERILLIY